MSLSLDYFNRSESQCSSLQAEIDPEFEHHAGDENLWNVDEIWNAVQTQFDESAKPTPEEMHKLLCLLDERYGTQRKAIKRAYDCSLASGDISGMEIARSQLEELRQISILTATSAIRHAKFRRLRQTLLDWRTLVLAATGLLIMWQLLLI